MHSRVVIQQLCRVLWAVPVLAACLWSWNVRAQPATKEAEKQKPDYVLPAMPKDAKFFVKEGDFDADGEPEILVETKILRLVFDPKIGGRVGSWVYKPTGHDFTNRPGIRIDGGMLGDHVSEQGYFGDWCEAEYTWKVEQLDDRVLVHLRCPGKTGPLAYIIFNKTITLVPDSAAVRVDYDIQNDFRSTVPLTYGIWFHNCAAGRKETGPRFFFFPTEVGIQKIPIEIPKAQLWLRGPGRGWAAAVAAKTMTGLTAVMDNRYMRMHYTWLRGMVVPTFEWRFLPVKIESGQSFRTTQTYLAFTGLKKINGAGEAVAGSVEVVGEPAVGKPVKVVASVVGARPMRAELVLTAQRLPGGAVQELGRGVVNVPQVGAASHEFTFSPKEEGTYALVVKVAVNRQAACELEEPLQVGKASAAYALLPEEPRLSAAVGPKPKDIDVSFHSKKTVTPHVKWARPYAYPAERAGKRLKALILCEARGQREVVELEQRMDLDVDTSYLSEYYPNEDSYDYGHLLSEEMLAKRVLKFFEPEKSPYDVVIVSGAIWKLLGKFAAQRVREWTNDGTGLIVLGATGESEAPWDILPVGKPVGVLSGAWNEPVKHRITDGLPHTLMPAVPFWNNSATGRVIATAASTPAVIIGTHGQGRTVAITYKTTSRPGIPTAGLTPVDMEGRQQEFKIDYWEYYYSMLAKAILWAAKVTPQVAIENVAVQQPIDLSSGEAINVKCTLKATRPGQARLVYTTHRGLAPRAGLVRTKLLPVAEETSIVLPLDTPLLRAGPNVLDIWVKDEKDRVLDWTTTIIHAQAPIEVEAVTLAKDSFERGEPIAGEVMLRRRDAAPDARLRLSIVDPQSRVLWRTERGLPKEESFNFSARLDAPIFCPHELVVEIGIGDRVLAGARKTFLVQRPRAWDDFQSFMWGTGYIKGSRMYLEPTIARVFREHGITSVHLNAYDWYLPYMNAIASEGLYLVGGGGGWGRPSDATNDDPTRPVRRQSPIDDEVLKKVRNWGLNYGKRCKKYSIFNHMTGDENAWGEHWKPDYLAKFRQWLKEEYGTIATLNREWESSFKDFDSVMPLTTDEARQAGRFAPWVDFRRFDAHALTTYFATMRKAMHETDREASLHVSGSQDPRATNAHDWSLLARNLDSVRCYGNVQAALIHSFAPDVPVAPYGHGMRGNPPHLHPRIWRGVFDGTRGFSTCHEGQNFNPDLSFSSGFEHLKRNYIPLTTGLGKALIHADRKAPVAVHYSYPSTCVAFMMRIENHLFDTRRGLFAAVPEVGRAMRFVDRQLIEGGSLTDGETHVLVLPHSVALSDEEVGGIRKFVEGGGVALADLAPGITTWHGRRRAKGALDDLFGVDRSKARLIVKKRVLVGTGTAHGIHLSDEAEATSMETGIVATTATATAKCRATDAPALFVNRVGKGLAVLINGDLFSDYDSLSQGRHLPAYRNRLRALDGLLDSVFTAAGAPPVATFAAADGKPVERKYLVQFKAGSVTYVGLLRNDTAAKESREVTIQFSARGNIYDVLDRKIHLNTDRVGFKLNPVHIKVFAIAPYRVKHIAAALPKSAEAGQVVRFAVEIWTARGLPGDHVIRMDVSGPDGKERWYLAQNILAKSGQGEAVIPFALSDPAGTWTVRFRDIVSGTVAKRQINLVQE